MRLHAQFAGVVFLLLHTAAAWAADAAVATYPPPSEVKTAFLKLLDRPKVPADPSVINPVSDEAGIIFESFTIASEKRPDGSVERVPIVLVRPEKKGKLPVVIVLHGTGGNKDAQSPWLTQLAARGMIGVAIDARYHGARAGVGRGSNAYNQAIIKAWRTPEGQPHEYPFFYDTCWDIWRTIDYLVSRDDVDPARIGMIGISMGGIETWLSAAVDERVSVVVPAISVQCLDWSLENEKWQGRARTIQAAHEAARADLGEKEVNSKVCRALWSKIIPGMLDQFDCPSMVRLLAGRPTLVINGELDPNCPLPGAEIAFASAREAFAAKGASEKLRVEVAKGVGHTITPAQREMAIGWCEKWLLK